MAYGKGRHPAGLNFADCFVYALAKTRGAPLLFKGDDFIKDRHRGGVAAIRASVDPDGDDRADGRKDMNASDRQTPFPAPARSPNGCASTSAGLKPICASTWPDLPGPSRVSQFKGGQSNPTYLVETPQRRYVLRRKPPGKLLPSAHAVDREFRVISALYRAGLPSRRADPLLRRRKRDRHGVLCHVPCRGPRVLGTGNARVQSGRARAGL